MPKFSALLYARHLSPELERALLSLQVANDILLIDDTGDPETTHVARRYHARVKQAIPGVTPGAFAMDTFHPWILVLREDEQLSEELVQALKEWKQRKQDDATGYALGFLHQAGEQWQSGSPELRLVNRHQINWMDELPPNAEAALLPGTVLRYAPEDAGARKAS